MKDYFSGIMNSYNGLVGTSKIVPAAALLIAAVILLYNDESKDMGRRIHPAVFLLSVYSGISYVIVCAYRKSKSLPVLLFSAVIICMTGEFVFSENALKKSIYTNGETFEIIFAVIAILIYFLIYGLIACRLFADNGNSDRLIFLFSMVLLSLFGFYSERLRLSALLLSPLSVSSIVLHGILPFLLWLCLVYEDKINTVFDKYFALSDDADESSGEEYEEGWDMKKHKILNIRNMAIAVLVIVVCFAGAVFVLNNKINTLYDATVLLNNAANDKAGVYEIRSGDDICATIIVSSYGNVTVIGGGEKANGTILFEEIKKHSDYVSKWLLYGEDEENKGAYDFCVSSGISVDNTYVLTGLKELE